MCLWHKAETNDLVAQPLLAVQTSAKSMTFYRRNLPHWHPEGKAIFLTWRLFGSLHKCTRKGAAASSRATRTNATNTAAKDQDWGGKFRMADAELDRGACGPHWLRKPEIAGYVENAILRGAEIRHYELYAYVIMPNHVHVLLQPLVPLARITGGIKGVSARDANSTLGRVGKPFWQDESFDHWVRNSSEFERIWHYIEWNPVKAKLAARPENWKWSSAATKDLAQPRLAVPPDSSQLTEI